MLELGVVDADRAAAEFPTVEDEIVMLRAHRVRVGVEQRRLTRCGRREWMMRRGECARLGVALEEREADDPAEREFRGIAQAESLGDVQT